MTKEQKDEFIKMWQSYDAGIIPNTEPKVQMMGWVCPVCGRGLSPYTAVCPCKNGKGWRKEHHEDT